MQRRNFVALVLLGLALGLLAWSAATAQPVDVPVESVVEVTAWDRALEVITVWIPRLCILASMLTAAVPSTGKFMAVVDRLAFAWGKARNDPAAQKWGG